MTCHGLTASSSDQPVVRCARNPLCGIVVRMLKHISLSIAIALLGSGIQSQQAATLDWTACPNDKAGMTCADLQVPADWQKPTAARSPSSWAG